MARSLCGHTMTLFPASSVAYRAILPCPVTSPALPFYPCSVVLTHGREAGPLFTVHGSLFPVSKLNVELTLYLGLAPSSLFDIHLNMGMSVNLGLAPS